jgi:hypothetical protein
MERTVTRYDLSSAIIHILEASGVSHPRDAVEVLGSPGNGVHLFVVIPSQRAKVVLAEKLMRITGYRHPTAGDVWILARPSPKPGADSDGRRLKSFR